MMTPGVHRIVAHSLQVEAEVCEDRLSLRCLAHTELGWRPVARYADLEVRDAAGRLLPAVPTSVSTDGHALHQEFQVGDAQAERVISIGEDGWIAVETRLHPASEPRRLGTFLDRLVCEHEAAWTYLPSVGGFAPDAQYKAPLAMIQGGACALGIVPDLDALDRAALLRCNHAIMLDASDRGIAVGFAPAVMTSHCVYSVDPGRSWLADGVVVNRYHMRATASSAPAQAFRDAVRLHWRRYGRPRQRRSALQQAGTGDGYADLLGFDAWRRRVWTELTPTAWLPVPLPDGRTGGAVAMDRWGGSPSVYLGSWFNSLRTAVGMAMWAREAGRDDLLGLATRTLELALHAPGRSGAFSCIAVPRPDGVRWGAGDGCGASTERGFLGFDMAWTGYWMLRWRAAGLPGSEPVLARCQALASFLAGHQQEDGLLPTFFDADGRCDLERSRQVHAEGGAVALFLLELSGQDGDPAWRAVAERCLAFIAREVAPSRRWYDFETFWSCSPRGIARDRATGQWPANNLALIPTVHAFLLAARLGGDRRWLVAGQELLDYLLLSQQCWTNPVIEGLSCPEMLLGGFTSQNSDAEWSDARQSQAGIVLLDYWLATGIGEYLERGVAALRAQFPVSPSENWAHCGYGGKAGVSSFHWGTGSGMAGLALAGELLGDVVVDAREGIAVGVDAIDAESCVVRDQTITLRLRSAIAWNRAPVLKVHHAAPGTWRVVVNGADVAIADAERLRAGVPIAPAAFAVEAPPAAGRGG